MPDTNTNYIFGTGSIPINIKTAQLATFADGTTKQQGYQVAEVNKLISTMLTGWDKDGNKPKSMSDNYMELILSCDNGFVVKKRLQFPHIIAWKDDSTPYNIADIYKEFSIDNWLKADDFENPDITLVVEPTDEILTTSTATPPEVTTTNSGRFYLYYRNLPVGVNRIHIDFHIKTQTEPIDFDLEVFDGISWEDAQTILASNEQAKINVLLCTAKDIYNFSGVGGDFNEITIYKLNQLYFYSLEGSPENKFTHDLCFYLYDESEINTKLTELEGEVNPLSKFKDEYLSIDQGTEDITTSISDVVDGYVTKDGIAGTSATNYKNTGKVAVVEGDIVTFISSQSTTEKSKFAYLCAWDENGNALPSLGLNDVNETTYVVPSSVHFVTLTFNATDYPVNNLCVYITRAVTNVAFPKLDALDAFVEEDSYDAIDYPQVAQIPGNYWSGVISNTASYFHIHLENLKEGDVITFFSINDGNYTYRYLDAYKGTTRVPSASSNVGAKVVTIPSGVDNIYLSYLNGYSEGKVRIVRATTSKSLKGLTLPSNIALRKCAASVKAEALQPNTILYLFKNFDNKKNSSLEVYAKFDSFDRITLGHGGDIGYGNKVVVDAEKITCYYNGTQNFQVSHGLAISSYIHIIVTRGKRTNARVTINTTSGTFTTEEINFIACSYSIYAVSSSALSDVVLSYVAKDLLKDIYLFGDSYISLMDSSRYPKYLDEVYNCIDNMMICGFGGVNSMIEIKSLISALSLAKPKYLIWALGMNDADSSSAVNANWLTCYNEVIEYCKRYEIVPIFCTIPNVPTINNSFKNDIVRNSGYRYIDFAKAVNAENVGSSWYSGMLSDNGVHPTELGAKALAARFITDFPEVMG